MLLHSAYFQSLLLFCVILIHVVPFVTTTSSLPKKEMLDEVALRAFQSKIIHDPQGVFNSWNDSHHFCQWEGITCRRKHRRVTILDLSSRNLYGSLSPYIGNLSFLRELRLYNNSVQGEIPPEFGRLSRLEVLFLHNNSLVGEIPANLSHCSRLTHFNLIFNKLVGRIPPHFVSLYNLMVLGFYSNNLTGGIPSFLGNLTSLKQLSLGNNPLGGHIPDSLGQLRRLTFLVLQLNNLSGTMPLSLFNLTLLTHFTVGGNQLCGSLSPNLGLTLPNLKFLQVSQNFFSGFIPVSLSNCSQLRILQMVLNNFAGKVSINFGGMQYLGLLSLGDNNLGSGEADEMNFINSLVNLTNLKILSIKHNQFRGTLPHSIANLSTALERFDFGNNQFHGSIPLGITNLVNLVSLSMRETQITGPIPKEIGNLYNLRILLLDSSQLSGEIPSSLGNLSLLWRLELSNNELLGVIPSSLGNLKQLTILNLFQNDLNGTIPEQLFDITFLSIVLNLSQNHLVGYIPRNISKMKALSKFDVSDNNLSGEIPNDVGQCVSLEYLYMRGNIFHGSIPISLSSLKAIREIDISRNNLSGQIPKFLESLRLEKLNLSFNDLEGEVPRKGIFANSSAISVVGNSNRLCGGIVDLQLPKCLNNISNKDKSSLVFKILISTASTLLGVAMLSFSIFCWIRKRKNKQTLGPMWRKTFPKVSYEWLLKATDGFSPTHLIGIGSFGSVYKGILDQDGPTVAIKVLNLQRQGASKSFMAECKALRNIRHRNLVKVITSCSSTDFQGNDFKAIVYDFMANGSLEKWLHQALEVEDEQFKPQSLTLLQRVNITIDVASALDYLHHHCQEPILHCDLKPSNILLNNDMIAHVGDFGLVKFLPEVLNSNQSSSIGVKGTIGYTAPEYGLGNEVSTNGDVYSFGILLLEMLIRKKPTDLMFKGDLNLHNYARIALPNRVMDIVDPELVNEEVATVDQRMSQASYNCRKECLISIIRIGVTCSLESPQNRMDITKVVHELESIKNILLQPTASMKKGE